MPLSFLVTSVIASQNKWWEETSNRVTKQIELEQAKREVERKERDAREARERLEKLRKMTPYCGSLKK